jgi:hypothetical protein
MEMLHWDAMRAILPEIVCLAVTVEIAFHGSRC